MLNVFTLASTINESVIQNQYFVEGGFEFAGNLFESTCNMEYMSMMESLDSRHFTTSVDEIMVEAAVGNPQNVDVLVEASLKEIWGKIVAAVQKAWEWVKGLIAKVITFVKSTIVKTKTYQNNVIKAAKKLAQAGKDRAVNVTAYKYDVASIEKMTDGIIDVYKTYIGDEFEHSAEVSMSVVANSGSKDPDEIIKYAEKNKEDYEKQKGATAIANALNRKLDAGAAEDSGIKEIYNSYVTKVRGEKQEMPKHASDIAGMVEGLSRYTKILDDGTKVLKEYEAKLKKILPKLRSTKASGGNENYGKTMEANLKTTEDASKQAKIRQASQQALNACYNAMTKMISTASVMLGSGNGTLRMLCNGMLANDMSIINVILRASKVSNEYKGEPDSKSNNYMTTDKKHGIDYSGKNSYQSTRDAETDYIPESVEFI